MTAGCMTYPESSVSGHEHQSTAQHALSLVERHKGVWEAPPTHLRGRDTADGPLLGNGDVGVVMGGAAAELTWYLGKSDFWSPTTNEVAPVGRIAMSAPALEGATYRVAQHLAHAEVRGNFHTGATTLETTTWLCAVENLLVTAMILSGPSPVEVRFEIRDGSGAVPELAAIHHGDILAQDLVAEPGAESPIARVAIRLIGADVRIEGHALVSTLVPGIQYQFVTTIVSDHDEGGAEFRTHALSRIAGNVSEEITARRRDHRRWWRAFWSKSFIEIDDDTIESAWYGALYILGCASRSGKNPPGLWGHWITGPSMWWSGDYHTNYNYQVPFLAALATNHVEQTDNYHVPVLDYVPRARELAAARGFRGVYYGVGLSPNGRSADEHDYGQRSNAAYLAVPMIARFLMTWDHDYGRLVLPYLREVAEFWMDYLEWDESGLRYVVSNDAPQEETLGAQTNNSLSLALVRNLLDGVLAIGEALGEETPKLVEYARVRDGLSDFPTATVAGQLIFAQTEDGTVLSNDGNDINIQLIYPFGQLGLNSDGAHLQIARNTIDQLDRAWHGDNAPATFYCAAARVGYDAERLLDELRLEATEHIYPNLHIHHRGGGFENINVVGSGLCEMLLQSHQHDVKVFPAWPRAHNAAFGGLRAVGGFLVSSRLGEGRIEFVEVISEKGRPLTLTNPWPEARVLLSRDGGPCSRLSGAVLRDLRTIPGERLVFTPDEPARNADTTR